MNFALFNMIDYEELRIDQRRRVYRQRVNFDRQEKELSERVRLTEEHIEFVVDRLSPFIVHPTTRNAALTPRQQIILSLRYLSTGDNFRTVADAHGVHKSTLSRALHRFVNAVNGHLYDDIVDWPDPDRVTGMANKFYTKAGLPCVIGCIDGTNFRIVGPSRNEQGYVDRHGQHSIKGLVVCGPTLRILYADTRWPGAVGDARVYRNSTLKRRFDDGWNPLPNGYLLADSGFGNSQTVLTPLRRAVTRAENEYNRRHRKTRCAIECAIGVLKQRFRCLLNAMHLAPEFASEVALCCIALHNLLLPEEEANAILNDFVNDFVEENLENEEPTDDEIEENGNNFRRRQIVQLFR